MNHIYICICQKCGGLGELEAGIHNYVFGGDTYSYILLEPIRCYVCHGEGIVGVKVLRKEEPFEFPMPKVPDLIPNGGIIDDRLK